MQTELRRADFETKEQKTRLDKASSVSRIKMMARDPFMEHAMSQGIFAERTAEMRKKEMAFKPGQQAIKPEEAITQHRAQAILARQSVQVKKESEMANLQLRLAEQMGEVTKAGLAARTSIRGSFEGQMRDTQSAINAQPDPLATLLGGAVQGIAGEEGGLDWLSGGLLSKWGLGGEGEKK